MADNLVDTGDASSHVLRDLFVMPLRDEVELPDGFISDPKDRGDGDAPMVLTSLPDSGLLYPHVIVERASQSGDSLDRHGDTWEHDMEIRVTVHSLSSTQANKLIDGIVAWFEINQWWLHNNGFMDTATGPIQDANWEAGARVNTVQITFRGRLTTTP